MLAAMLEVYLRTCSTLVQLAPYCILAVYQYYSSHVGSTQNEIQRSSCLDVGLFDNKLLYPCWKPTVLLYSFPTVALGWLVNLAVLEKEKDLRSLLYPEEDLIVEHLYSVLL